MNIVHEPKNGVLIPSRTMECWERSTLSSTCCPISKKICSRFANQNRDAFRPTKFQIWYRCSQGKYLTQWVIFKAGYWTDADKMMAAFTEAIKFYRERFAGVKYLSNFIIRILRTNKEPVLVSIKNYIYRRNEIEFHLSGPYLCHNLALPTLHKKAEQIFDNQPKQHQFMLGKHWRATNMDAHYQCSPETDHDFLRDSPLMEFQVEVFQASKWRVDKPVILAKHTNLARGTRQDSNLLQVEGFQANTN